MPKLLVSRSFCAALFVGMIAVSGSSGSFAAEMTINGIDVSVENAGRENLRSTPNGFEVEVDRHRVVFDNGVLRIDGHQLQDVAKRPNDVRIDARGWGLEVFVDGRSVYRLTEIDALMEAAGRGDATAMNNLGVRYLRGAGVPQDPSRAVEYYRMAAEKGLAMAQSNLAHLYWRGKHVPQDKYEAIRLARTAAEGGNVPAMSLLGIALVKGEGVAPNVTEGVFWLRKAADQGNRAAMNDLAIRYARGEGVPQDYAKAAEWYRKAADQGSVVAKSNLAFAYWRGRGVPRDLDKAEELFVAAAGAGNEIARDSLAKLRAERGDMATVASPSSGDGSTAAGKQERGGVAGLPPTEGNRTGTSTDAGTPPPLPSHELQVFVAIGSEQRGPFDTEKLSDLARAGDLNADTLVWMKGMADWRKAGEIEAMEEVLAAVSTAETGPPQPQLPDIEFYVALDGKQHGPVSMTLVVEMIDAGEITDETMVWTQGMANWKAASDVADLAPFLKSVPRRR